MDPLNQLMSDFHNDLIAQPRANFIRNMSSLVGEKFHNYILKGCKLDESSDTVDLYLLNGRGQVETFRGSVPRHEMDLTPSELKDSYETRIQRASG